MKKSKINVITGLFSQAIGIGLGLILPYLFITNLGSEANGLLNSINQLFVCLSLLEAGVGGASIQALYKPVAENNRKSINEILSATKYYYQKTGVLYTLAIIVLSILYPYFVDSKLSDLTIRMAILLQGMGTVVSFFIQAKYICLLEAEGKIYIKNGLTVVESLFRNIAKIIAIQLGFGIIAIQWISLATLLLEAVFVICYFRMKYQWLNFKSKPNFKAISQKNSVLVQSVAWTVFNHTDLVVLTLFSGDLKIISVYTVYTMLFEVIQNITDVLRGSFQYKIGQVAQRSKEELSEYFRTYIKVIFPLTSALLAIVYTLSIPFIELYTSSATDVDYVILFLPELFLLYKMLYAVRIICRQVIDAAGHFQQIRRIGVIEASLNIVLSIILVSFLGIYGVLLGTILSLFFSAFRYIIYAGETILCHMSKEIGKQVLYNIIPLVLIVFFCQMYKIQVSNYVQLILISIPVVLVFCIIYGTLCWKQCGAYLKQWIKK